MRIYLKFRLLYNIYVFCLGRWLPEEKSTFAKVWRKEDGLPQGTPAPQEANTRFAAQIRMRAYNMLTGKFHLV